MNPIATIMASPRVSSKQATTALVSLVLEISADLILSLVGYISIVFILNLAVRLLVLAFFFSVWDHSQIATFNTQSSKISTALVLSLWTSRFVFRTRKHWVCFFRWLSPHLIRLICWLSPFSPASHTMCPLCRPVVCQERTTVLECEDQSPEQRSFGIFL